MPIPLKWFLLLAATVTTASSFIWSIPYRCSSSIIRSTVTCNNRASFIISHKKTRTIPKYTGIRTTKTAIDSSSSSKSNEIQDNRIPQKATPLPPISPTTITPSTRTNAILQAAANLTEATSPLLGIKSLGIDYGLARTGLAVTIGYSPKPLSIIASQNTTQLCIQILQTVENERVDRIVLGLPYHTNGTESEQTRVTREFAGFLVCEVAKRFGMVEGVGGRVPIYLWDERYTSKEAAARARSVDPGVNLYKELDAEAACIILEYYYEDGGLDAEEVDLPNDEEVIEEVERAWAKGREERERCRVLRMQKREDCLNARQMAMDRSKVLEEKLAAENSNSTFSKRDKKKKKRRKKRGNGSKKWIIL